jgi:two-component system, cell cycle sensor histidine kinase and response regulator CckA
MVKADPGQIAQILSNLVVNARDAMPTGGKLTIETGNAAIDEESSENYPGLIPGKYIMITVSDTGIGMTEEVLSHIFEPFFTTKPRGTGTGLGLSTCYGIVKQNNGGIYVASAPGQGTSVRIYLPSFETIADVLKTVAAAVSFPGGNETLFLVEDDSTIRTLIKQNLVSAGYFVLDAENGEEAISLVLDRQDPIDLLITDVVMPVMSGKLLADRLSTLFPGLKVLFMSGYTDDEIARHGVLEEDTSFIQKPFSIIVFMEKIREILDR